MRTMRTRLRRGVLALAVTLVATALTAPAAGGVVASSESPAGGWLVRVRPGAAPAVATALRERGVQVTRTLATVDMLVVRATDRVASALRSDARVSAVTPDTGVRLLSDTWTAKHDVNSAYNVGYTVGARAMWATTSGRLQWTGAGVDVALLDTGVSPVPGLTSGGKVLNGPDLSFDSQDTSTRYLDGFGHGTHMAGIIAGRDADADPSRPGESGPFLGMAPDARIVNVKVADAWGNADVSQIIAGIDWVVQHRKSDGLNIRVLNLSLGTPSTQSALLDPLSHAVEQAWHKGIVVVVAVGNDGTGTGQLLNPARNPYVIAVGANDSKGTIPTDDDVIPGFSTRGDGVRNPDIVAPGRSVQSLRVPGSYIDEQYPAGRLGERFFRGSGTSQAAAVVSGGIALLLQQRPDLTPEDVKYLLTTGARALPAADAQAQGHGMFDLRKPSDVGKQSKLDYKKQAFTKAGGKGSLDAARGGYRVEQGDGVVLTGEQDIFAKAFDSAKHADSAAVETTWLGGKWNTSDWIGSCWTEQGWQGVTWSGVDWAGRAWAGRAWAGGTWTGRAWGAGYWSGRAWAGRSWAGRAWATGAWG